jgi:ATP-dependent DNA ligase
MSRASEIDTNMLAHLWAVLSGRSGLDENRHIEGWLSHHRHVSAEEIARLLTRGYKHGASRGHRVGSLSYFDGAVQRADIEARMLAAPGLAVRCPRCGQLEP